MRGLENFLKASCLFLFFSVYNRKGHRGNGLLSVDTGCNHCLPKSCPSGTITSKQVHGSVGKWHGGMEIDQLEVLELGFNVHLYTHTSQALHTHTLQWLDFSHEFSFISSPLGMKTFSNYRIWRTKEFYCLAQNGGGRFRWTCVFWEVALLVGDRHDVTLHTTSHARTGHRVQGSKTVPAALGRRALRAIPRRTGAYVKHLLARTTKVRVVIQVHRVYESDHFWKAAIWIGRGGIPCWECTVVAKVLWPAAEDHGDWDRRLWGGSGGCREASWATCTPLVHACPRPLSLFFTKAIDGKYK